MSKCKQTQQYIFHLRERKSWYLVRASAINGKWRGHDLSEALSGGFGGEVLSALDGGEGGEQNLGLGFFFFFVSLIVIH